MFSVIIPVYNVKEYLNSCIDSILAQTFKDYEILLIDDGSTDGSEIICDQYSAKYDNIRVFHKNNGGQSSARNMGVDMSNGNYMLFIDSDDYISRDTLELFDSEITKHGRLDVILSSFMYYVEPDGRIRDVLRHYNIPDYAGITGRQALLMTGMEWSPCGKCFRTEYWKEKGFRFIEGRISEDFQLMDRVTLEADKVSMIPAHYYYRWKNPSSTMHAYYGKLVRDTLFVIEDWDSYLLEKRFDNGLDNMIRITLAKMFEHTVMGNVTYADRDEVDDLLKKIDKATYHVSYDKSFEGYIIRMALATIGVKRTCNILGLIKRIRKSRL